MAMTSANAVLPRIALISFESRKLPSDSENADYQQCAHQASLSIQMIRGTNWVSRKFTGNSVMEELMRRYIFAIATAAIFAIPTAAFSESVSIGPGGVRIGPPTTTVITIATKEEDAAQNCGRLAFTRNSWASKEWAIARDIAQRATSSGSHLPDPGRELARGFS
jgi:hypothetical protein